jgi:hypothetical protein
MARNQLSVKQYLVVIAIACAPVILWGIYRLTFTESISAAPARVGQPIVVRGRYPGWYGASYLVFAVGEHSPRDGAETDEEASSAGAGEATRGWLGHYQFETTIDPISEPGEYHLIFVAPEHKGGGSTAATTVTISP